MSERVVPTEVKGRIVQTIQEGERFSCYKLQLDTGFAFLKILSDEALRPRVQQEIGGNRAFMRLAKEEPDAGFRVPKILAASEDWVLTEWIDGMPLVKEYTTQSIRSSISAVAAAHAFTDNYLPRPGAPTRFTNIHQELTDKFTARHIRRFFDEATAQRALAFVVENLSSLTAVRAHADLTPRHLLRQADSALAIVDFEGSRNDWPRFYEPINYWTKIVLLYNEPLLAKSYLSEFFAHISSDQGDHDLPLRVNAAVRVMWHMCELINEGGRPTERFTPWRRECIEALLAVLPKGPFSRVGG